MGSSRKIRENYDLRSGSRSVVSFERRSRGLRTRTSLVEIRSERRQFGRKSVLGVRENLSPGQGGWRISWKYLESRVPYEASYRNFVTRGDAKLQMYEGRASSAPRASMTFRISMKMRTTSRVVFLAVKQRRCWSFEAIEASGTRREKRREMVRRAGGEEKGLVGWFRGPTGRKETKEFLVDLSLPGRSVSRTRERTILVSKSWNCSTI